MWGDIEKPQSLESLDTTIFFLERSWAGQNLTILFQYEEKSICASWDRLNQKIPVFTTPVKCQWLKNTVMDSFSEANKNLALSSRQTAELDQDSSWEWPSRKPGCFTLLLVYTHRISEVGKDLCCPQGPASKRGFKARFQFYKSNINGIQDLPRKEIYD